MGFSFTSRLTRPQGPSNIALPAQPTSTECGGYFGCVKVASPKQFSLEEGQKHKPGVQRAWRADDHDNRLLSWSVRWISSEFQLSGLAYSPAPKAAIHSS